MTHFVCLPMLSEIPFNLIHYYYIIKFFSLKELQKCFCTLVCNVSGVFIPTDFAGKNWGSLYASPKRYEFTLVHAVSKQFAFKTTIRKCPCTFPIINSTLKKRARPSINISLNFSISMKFIMNYKQGMKFTFHTLFCS